MASKAINTDHDFGGTSRIQGLPAASGTGQPVRYDEFNAAIQGLAWKDDVVAASTANINLAAPGTSVDGVTLANGDRFLAKDQTTASQNGVYIFNGSATPATRSVDMDASAEFNAAVVPVAAGGAANANTRWRSTVANPTVGTTAITFTSDQTSAPSASETTQGIAEIATQAETDAGTDDVRFVTPLKLGAYSGRAKRYAVNVGDGSSTSINVTHNLATTDVQVFVREAGGNKREVDCEVRSTDSNTVTLLFNAAPASAAMRAIVTA